MATLADVARHAGVSQSTVSYVLSGKRTISAATRRPGGAAAIHARSATCAGRRRPRAGQLGARACSRSSTPLRAGLHTPVAMEFVTSVVTAARRHAHDVLLLTNDEGPEGIRRVAGSALVDGLVLMDVQLRDDRIPVLRELGLPAVLIGVPDDTAGLTCATSTSPRAAGERCVDHLGPSSATARSTFVGHDEAGV